MDPLQISRKEASKKIELLTPRQREVLFLLARGYSYKEISNLLKVGYTCVSTHSRNTCYRLGTKTTMQSVMLMGRSRP